MKSDWRWSCADRMRHLQHCNCWNYNSITFHGLRNSFNRHGCAQCICGGRNQAWRSIAQRPGFGSTLSIHKRVNWSEEFRKIKFLWYLSSMFWSRKSNWNLSWWHRIDSLCCLLFYLFFFIPFITFDSLQAPYGLSSVCSLATTHTLKWDIELSHGNKTV